MADQNFKHCIQFLGENPQAFEGSDQTWRKIAENEALQVIDDWKRQREKDEKILSKYQNLLFFTRFKGVEVPEQDYTEFLRVKSRCKSEAHRLIESLLVARDELDEDPGKLYGVLDLQEVIQVIAARSKRTDVFLLDEIVSKSYSWIIMLDASESMKSVADFAMEIFLMMAEAANELLLDPTSWALYAFNDRLFVIKDMKERYNVKVKSRIGGIRFDGFSYIPDALNIAGEIMKTRNDKLRLVTVISDGWPYGYPNIATALTETVNTLESRQIVPVGIGAKSTRMSIYFRSNCSAFNLRDLTKQFSKIFIEESRIAAET
ncbi:VWA domain-containing protein [Candidatus Bathyarchaeota archaeon]|nr:VWA domain-containing protein [Candidatus Bathyarchaeota archaeon]